MPSGSGQSIGWERCQTEWTTRRKHPVGRLLHPDKSPRVANLAPHTAAETSSFHPVSDHFNVAADRLCVPDDLRTVVRTAYREVQAQIPVRLRDTGMHGFSGYRVQNNGARGRPRAGSATTSARTLGRCACGGGADDMKTAIVDIPFGGAKGGVLSPRGISMRSTAIRRSVAVRRE
jgi:hypothetical protein